VKPGLDRVRDVLYDAKLIRDTLLSPEGGWTEDKLPREERKILKEARMIQENSIRTRQRNKEENPAVPVHKRMTYLLSNAAKFFVNVSVDEEDIVEHLTKLNKQPPGDRKEVTVRMLQAWKKRYKVFWNRQVAIALEYKKVETENNWAAVNQQVTEGWNKAALSGVKVVNRILEDESLAVTIDGSKLQFEVAKEASKVKGIGPKHVQGNEEVNQKFAALLAGAARFALPVVAEVEKQLPSGEILEGEVVEAEATRAK
jgi:hypothetical protein